MDPLTFAILLAVAVVGGVLTHIAISHGDRLWTKLGGPRVSVHIWAVRLIDHQTAALSPYLVAGLTEPPPLYPDTRNRKLETRRSWFTGTRPSSYATKEGQDYALIHPLYPLAKHQIGADSVWVLRVVVVNTSRHDVTEDEFGALTIEFEEAREFSIADELLGQVQILGWRGRAFAAARHGQPLLLDLARTLPAGDAERDDLTYVVLGPAPQYRLYRGYRQPDAALTGRGRCGVVVKPYPPSLEPSGGIRRFLRRILKAYRPRPAPWRG